MEFAKKQFKTRQDFQNLLTNSGDGIIVHDAEGHVVSVNEAFLEMVGYAEKEILGKHFLDLLPEKGMSVVTTGDELEITDKDIKYQKKKASEIFKKGIIFCRFYYKCKNSKVMPGEATYSVMYDPDGVKKGSIGVVRDITDRIKDEKEIEESRYFYENIFTTFADGIIVTDQWGMIIRVNKAIEKMLGYDLNEIIGKHPSDFIPVLMVERQHDEDVKRKLLKLTDSKLFESYETAFRNKDGNLCYVELKGSLGKDNNRMGRVICVKDITERKRMDREVLRANRLASISALAGGVANDFNCILTTILGSINLAQSSINTEEDAYKNLLKAERAALRAKDLIDQLLIFSKGGTLNKHQVSIAEVLKDVCKQTLKGSDIQCEFYFGNNLWLVEIDREQISQVLRSLLINSDNAMPEGGIIKISAENYVVDSKMNLPLVNGNHVKISIQDQALGILNEYIQDIFDPYFLKGRERSGLVLATAYSVINKHNGLISVESEFGTGTTFFIYLPAKNKNN